MTVLERAAADQHITGQYAAASPHRQVRALAWLLDPDTTKRHRQGPGECSKRVAHAAGLARPAGIVSLLTWLPRADAAHVAGLLWPAVPTVPRPRGAPNDETPARPATTTSQHGADPSDGSAPHQPPGGPA